MHLANPMSQLNLDKFIEWDVDDFHERPEVILADEVIIQRVTNLTALKDIKVL